MATVANVYQLSMDWTDNPDNPSTGKFSVDWWIRQVNYAQRVLAQYTGYNLATFRVPIYQYTQSAALPTALCWGIVRVTLDGDVLDAKDVFALDSSDDGWRWEYGFPNQPANDGIEVLSSEAADITQKLTIYGTTYATGRVVTEEITLTGTSQAATVKTDWGDVYYMVLDSAATGDVTVREASANATIATISAGDLTAGTAPSTAAPDTYALQFPNLLLKQVPDEDKTLYLVGGSYPSDYTGSSDTVTGPTQVVNILAHGAAAMCEIADLTADTAPKQSIQAEAFWNSARQFSAYLDGLQRERAQAIEFYNPHA